jgi:hypothetical protein
VKAARRAQLERAMEKLAARAPEPAPPAAGAGPGQGPAAARPVAERRR